MTPELIHAGILIICLGITFIFPQTPLVEYDLQIASLLFIFFFITRRLSFFSKRSRLMESVLFTLIIGGLVNSTGGLHSPFFFLLYFLLFALTLLLESIIPIIVTLTLMLLFVMHMPQNIELSSLIPLISLAFMTPFALILGKEYEQTRILKQELRTQQENTFLFLSLTIKNHLKHITHAVENFIGDHQLHEIRKHARNIEKLIDMFEKE